MPVVSRWKAIGEGLRLSLGTLEQIETVDSHNPRDCMSTVLKHWLRRNYNIEAFGEPTWRTVVKVVAHSAAGNNCALALSIAGRHSGNTYTSFLHYRVLVHEGNAVTDEGGIMHKPNPSALSAQVCYYIA